MGINLSGYMALAVSASPWWEEFKVAVETLDSE